MKDYKCDNCGNIFTLSYNQQYKLEREISKWAFCSRKCRLEFISGPKSPYWKNDAPIKGKCNCCNKEFVLTRQQRYAIRCSKVKKLYCSNECHLNDMRGKKPHNWNGGRYKRSDGYVMRYAPEHPYAIDGYVMEHRFVMEQILGRYLDPEERVHHINGDRGDNRTENLMLMESQSAHSKLHAEDKKVIKKHICPICGKEFILSGHQRCYLKTGYTSEAYCSKKCYAKSLDTRMNVQCSYCGNIFMPKSSQWWKYKTGLTKQVFCNRECADLYRKSGKAVNR